LRLHHHTHGQRFRFNDSSDFCFLCCCCSAEDHNAFSTSLADQTKSAVQHPTCIHMHKHSLPTATKPLQEGWSCQHDKKMRLPITWLYTPQRELRKSEQRRPMEISLPQLCREQDRIPDSVLPLRAAALKEGTGAKPREGTGAKPREGTGAKPREGTGAKPRAA
jgi:hypothetical protein